MRSTWSDPFSADRISPRCVIDFHTADYIILLPHRGDLPLLEAIHQGIRMRLSDRFLVQKPYGGEFQQVNMERCSDFIEPTPHMVCYAAERGCPAAVVLEMSGNRDDVHAMVSRGGWARDGEWMPVPYVDEHSAELLFRHKVMRLLQDEGLLTEERTQLLLSWRHTGFSVHNRVRVEPEDQPGVERLARYIMRPPISL